MARHIILSDDGHNVADNAFHRLLAVTFFPESPRDQEQALFIAKLEQDEFRRVGQEGYQPTEILTAISQLIEKRSAQLYCAGLVSLTFIWLKHHGYTPSLNRASIIASCAACEFGQISWRPVLNPNSPDQFKPVTGDAATVERIFRKYRSVAHICAARVSAAGYLETTHLWDDAPEVTASLLQTSAAFQNALEAVTDVSGWNLWDVNKHFPAVLGGWPVLVPDNDLLYWISRGYELAVKDGLIKKLDGGR